MRQFLSRLGGLRAALDGRWGGSEWPFWSAVMLAALVVAREAARSDRLRLRRLVPEGAGAGADPDSSPGPIGPWPLGPP